MTKKDPSLSALPPFDDYASSINMERVAEAILGPPGSPKISDSDFDSAKVMVWAAGEKFLSRDLYDMQITGIEEPYEDNLQFSWGSQVFRGIKDLRGTLRGRINVTKKFAGKKVVVDWKTTISTLDTTWDERLLDSWQWKKYLYFDDADVMLYRGLNRDGKTRELLIERPPILAADVLIQLEGVALQRKSLIDAKLEIWPRKMPSACGAFGRECPYWVDCRNGTMPRVTVEDGKTFSYSSMDRFLLCPERYRRSVITEVQEDSTDESILGVAVHRGLADLYQQSKDLFQHEVL